jgi:hypothetical protein
MADVETLPTEAQAEESFHQVQAEAAAAQMEPEPEPEPEPVEWRAPTAGEEKDGESSPGPCSHSDTTLYI